jgi:hypothetical protein
MEPAVPRFFFVIRCPQFLVPDARGVDFSTEADARNYAARLTEKLLQDKSYKGKGFEVPVQDNQGRRAVRRSV